MRAGAAPWRSSLLINANRGTLYLKRKGKKENINEEKK